MIGAALPVLTLTPAFDARLEDWIPAFAGMSGKHGS